MATEVNTQSFWEHLDVLREAIIKIVAVAVVFGIEAFFFKEQLFDVVLAPRDDGFLILVRKRRFLYNIVSLTTKHVFCK